MGNDSILVEVVSASIGGSISASALYPLEVLKTKMQAESKQNSSNSNASGTTNSTSKPASSTSDQDFDEEEASLVVTSPVPSNSDSEEESQQQEHSSSASALKAASGPPESAVAYAKHLYDTEGIAPFYAGIGTSAFQSATEKALYFFAYTGLKNRYTFLTSSSSNPKGHQIGTTANLVLGCLAEWAHLPITLPLDCWTTKIQTTKNGAAPFAILMSMLKEGDGIKGMYKGIQAYTVLCLKPSIQYTVFEQVKGILLAKKRLEAGGGSGGRRKREESLSAMEAFLLGMVARTIATVAVFPYLRAKVMLQSQKKEGDGSNGKQTTSIPSMLKEMYSNGGLGELFQGIGPELTRGIFSAALMLMVKEKITFAVQRTLLKN